MVKYVKYPRKSYLHFDKQLSFTKKVERYVYDFEKNPTHSFLPLIFSEIDNTKFQHITDDKDNENIKRNGRKVPVKPKNRPIMYASHMDNFIYKHYGLQLNELYNDYIQQQKFDESVTAYRTNKKGKSNIHFAAEVINFIAESLECLIYVGDYTGFFENLDHTYLRKMINLLYDENKMPNHQYKIFKSLTNFAYINKKDINDNVGIDNKIRKNGKNSYFENFQDFRIFKNKQSEYGHNGEKIIKINTGDKGIPQGTAISAIYSNIYMLEIDKYITELINDSGGIYRRYSDDFIIILPKIVRTKFNSLINNIKVEIENSAKLEIHPMKSQMMMFDGMQLYELDSDLVTELDYLGFVFNGKKVKIREKSIYKYYRTAYKLIKKGKKVSKRKGYVRGKARLTYKRKIYQKYHIFGEQTDYKYKYKKRKYGTFITYAKKCQKVFDENSPLTENLMLYQIHNHQKNIGKRINLAIKELKEVSK